MSEHFPGCTSTAPSCHGTSYARNDPECLCNTCQHDYDACCVDNSAVTETSGLLCGVVKCPEYLKEEVSDHADT